MAKALQKTVLRKQIMVTIYLYSFCYFEVYNSFLYKMLDLEHK